MIKINDSDRYQLKELCSCREEDPMLLWFFDGNRYCSAWADCVDKPETAVIIAADFCFLFGKVKAEEEISDILLSNARYKVIIACSPEWESFMADHMVGKAYCYNRYAMKREPEVFDKNRLRLLVMNMDTSYEIIRIDEEIYKKVLDIDWAADGCCYFRSYEDYNTNGLGYIASKDGKIVCIASSYSYYRDGITVTIGTLEEHRRKGLAAACASSLILECLEKNIYPEWGAANLQSVALAEKLGYHFDKEFDVYSLLE